jgi:hypothetical protein
MKRFLYGLAALGLLVGGGGHVKGQGPIRLFAPPLGSTETHLNGQNDGGIAVGSAKSADGTTQGLILDTNTGIFTNYVAPGATYTALMDINNLGQMVGLAGDAAFNYTGFFSDGSSFTAVNFPGALITVPTGINVMGLLTGYYFDASFVAHGFVRQDDGSYVTLDVPGWLGTFAIGINRTGEIAGYGITQAGAKNGFFLGVGGYDTGNFGFGDGTSFEFHRINDSSLMVGAFDDANGVSHAFINQRDSNGNFFNTMLDPPGSTSASANGISNFTIDNRIYVGGVRMTSDGVAEIYEEIYYASP